MQLTGDDIKQPVILGIFLVLHFDFYGFSVADVEMHNGLYDRMSWVISLHLAFSAHLPWLIFENFGTRVF